MSKWEAITDEDIRNLITSQINREKFDYRSEEAWCNGGLVRFGIWYRDSDETASAWFSAGDDSYDCEILSSSDFDGETMEDAIAKARCWIRENYVQVLQRVLDACKVHD